MSETKGCPYCEDMCGDCAGRMNFEEGIKTEVIEPWCEWCNAMPCECERRAVIGKEIDEAAGWVHDYMSSEYLCVESVIEKGAIERMEDINWETDVVIVLRKQEI